MCGLWVGGLVFKGREGLAYLKIKSLDGGLSGY